jgi:hypothetical protein
LTRQATTTDLVEEQENLNHKSNNKAKKSTTHQINLKPKVVAPNTSTAVAIPSEKSADLQALGVKVKSMMEKGQKMIPNGKQANGTPRQATSFICKVCGKEGLAKHIRNHIESNPEVSENSRSREFSTRVSFIFSRSTTRNDFLKSRSRLET